MLIWCVSDRKPGSNLRSYVALRYKFKGAFQSFDPVAQTRDAKARSAARIRASVIDKSRTAIAYSDDDRLAISPNLNALPYCFPMMKSVVQSFLHDPVQADRYRQRKIRGQVANLTADLRSRRILMVLHGKPEDFIGRQSLQFRQYKTGRDIAELG